MRLYYYIIYNIIIKLSKPFLKETVQLFVLFVRFIRGVYLCPINNPIVTALDMDDTKAIVSTPNEEAVANQPREVGSASR